MVENESNRLTIFIGIYNGIPYLDSLKQQLINQDHNEVPIVVVDNCSNDDSWNALQTWKQVFGSRLTLHRNPVNLGAGGSLDAALKSGLIKTEWFTTMHQDDFYLENHIEALIKEIDKDDPRVVAICTLMGSMDEKGITQPTPPRAAWLVSNTSQVDSFLLNLRTQALSWPTSAFRTKEFIQCFAPWHSPTFSDTETTLKLCGYGEFRYIQTETIKYRENPNSESHVINLLESTIGASIGLTRIFSSPEFAQVLSKVEERDRSDFYQELVASIKTRLGSSSLSDFVQILATEECCRTWSYSELQSSKSLAEVYASVGSEFSSTLIASQINERTPISNQDMEETLRIIANRKGEMILGRASIKNRNKVLIRNISKLPLSVRKRLFKIYVHLNSIKNPDYYWNIFWK